MTPTITQQADTLATWTKEVKKPAATETAMIGPGSQELEPLGLALGSSNESKGKAP